MLFKPEIEIFHYSDGGFELTIDKGTKTEGNVYYISLWNDNVEKWLTCNEEFDDLEEAKKYGIGWINRILD